MRNILYDLLVDVYYRLTISFGYFQYGIRDMERDERKHTTHSPEWDSVEDVMNQNKARIFFFWENEGRGHEAINVPRRWPKWYSDFWIPYYTGEL